MSQFVPNGYMSIREALDHLGREHFPADWNGEEYKARTGLMSREEASKPGTGSSGSGSGLGRVIIGRPSIMQRAAVTPQVGSANSTLSRDPFSSSYQDERKAAERFEIARCHLRGLLERGELEAVILDPCNGILHPVPARMWRVSSADRMIRSGCAQIPHRGNDGHLFVKAFVRKSGRSPLPQAKMQEAIAALTAKAETESLTRPQQQEFLRRMFPAHHVTTRQLAQIFQSVPVAKGRSKKSRKKV